MTLNYPLLCIFLYHFAVHTAANEAIINGQLAEVDQFPYQVSVQAGTGHGCGGAIIDDLFILSAAHCVTWPDGEFHLRKAFVIAGTNNLNHISPPAVIGHVEKMYVPADFDIHSPKADGDITVFKLKQPLDLKKNRHLKKLELPSYRWTSHSGKKAIISGFGHTSSNITKIVMSDRLYYAEADVLTNKQCAEDNGPLIAISAKHICARITQHPGTIHSTCTGDSGSPLVVDGKIIIGILSKGPNDCSEIRGSGIYTRVSRFIDFIRDAKRDKKSEHIRSHVLTE